MHNNVYQIQTDAWLPNGPWSHLFFTCEAAMEQSLLLRMASSGMLRRVALVRTDVSEERSSSIIKETRIGELGTALAVTSNRRTLRRNAMRERSYTRLGMQRGVEVAGNGVGLLDFQTTKRDSIASAEGMGWWWCCLQGKGFGYGTLSF
jgi:hypothetical protein